MILDRVSITEISQFRDCRRAWYLSRVRGLESNVPNFNMWFGRGIHAGLEAYYDPNFVAITENRLQHALNILAVWYVKGEPELISAYGELWNDAQPQFLEAYTLMREILTNYEKYEQDEAGTFGKVQAVEKRIKVPIKGPNGHLEAQIVGKVDLAATTVGGQTSLVDHKTVKAIRNSSEALDIDEQMTGYAYLFWRTEGLIPAEIIYNIAARAIPVEPLVLKSGELSVDKRQHTTKQLYLDALDSRGIPPTGKYLEMLGVLEDRGWSDFFAREWTYRNLEQIISFEKRLYQIFRDMQEVAEHPEKAYPNPSTFRCPNCVFLEVCHGMEDGSDYESLIAARFTARAREAIIDRTLIG